MVTQAGFIFYLFEVIDVFLCTNVFPVMAYAESKVPIIKNLFIFIVLFLTIFKI